MLSRVMQSFRVSPAQGPISAPDNKGGPSPPVHKDNYQSSPRLSSPPGKDLYQTPPGTPPSMREDGKLKEKPEMKGELIETFSHIGSEKPRAFYLLKLFHMFI